MKAPTEQPAHTSTLDTTTRDNPPNRADGKVGTHRSAGCEEERVNGWEVAVLIAAGAFAVIALALAWLLLRLRRTVDAATRAISDLNDRTAPILAKADLTMDNLNTVLGQTQTSLDGVNLQLQRVDTITSHAAHVTANVANLATVVTSVAANPLIKAAAVGYGVRRAAARRAHLEDERELRALMRERRRGGRRASRGSRHGEG